MFPSISSNKWKSINTVTYWSFTLIGSIIKKSIQPTSNWEDEKYRKDIELKKQGDKAKIINQWNWENLLEIIERKRKNFDLREKLPEIAIISSPYGKKW